MQFHFDCMLMGMGREGTTERLGGETNNAAAFFPQLPPLVITTILSDTVSGNVLRKEPQRTSTGKTKFTAAAQSLPPSSSDRLQHFSTSLPIQ